MICRNTTISRNLDVGLPKNEGSQNPLVCSQFSRLSLPGNVLTKGSPGGVGVAAGGMALKPVMSRE